MLLFKILLFLLISIFLPILIGNELLGLTKQKITIAKSYVFGLITMWAVCQIVSVPLIFLKSSFILLVFLLSIIYGTLAIAGLYKKRWFDFKIPRLGAINKDKLVDYVFGVGLFIFIISLILTQIFHQHTDDDDSRFVVNAVDIVRTNKMFLINPSTGENWGSWNGEVIRDIISPWAIYIAYLAKLTGISVAITAHTMLPISLMLAVYATYWLLSDVFFHGKFAYRCIFVMTWLLLNLYGYTSLYTAETFLMTRIWQGKSVVASFGIPLQLLVLFWLYNEEETKNNRSYIIMLLLISFAMCFASGMGIILCAIIIGCYGLVYGIAKKNMKLMLAIWSAAIPNAFYFLLKVLI